MGQEMSLPPARGRGEMSVEEALARRRSCRAYRPDALSVEEVSQLLWAAQGVTDPGGLRAAPSAGACYPLETYLVCAEGLFHYQPAGHRLRCLGGDDRRARLAEACGGQGFVAQAPVTVAFSAVYARTTQHYGRRGERYVHMDAALAAANVHLQAEALGLGSVAVGAFDDRAVAGLLELPAEEDILYLVPVGRPE